MIGRTIAGACLVLVMASGPLQAQSYPDKLIKMIVPAPPGGQTDVLARFLGQRLQATLAKFGFSANIMSPQDLTAFIAGETKTWSNVAKAARVQVD